MSPDDPRHGTYAGTVAHYLHGIPTCLPCREAGAAYRRNRRTRMYLARSNSLEVPSLGYVRRVQALVALGYTFEQISAAMGRARCYASQLVTRPPEMFHRSTALMIADTYERLSARPPAKPSARAQRMAAKRGWAPPLAWNNIDDPSEKPSDTYAAYSKRGIPADELIAEVDFLTSIGESEEQVAMSLGVTVESIEQARLREARRARKEEAA